MTQDFMTLDFECQSVTFMYKAHLKTTTVDQSAVQFNQINMAHNSTSKNTTFKQIQKLKQRGVF